MRNIEAKDHASRIYPERWDEKQNNPVEYHGSNFKKRRKKRKENSKVTGTNSKS
jgi:hypothetical protein